MKIACPACSAAYDVPDDRVRPGRAVRCARCGGTWTPVAPEPPLPAADAPSEPPPAEVAPVVAQAPEREPEAAAVVAEAAPPAITRPARRAPVLLALAWVLSAALVIGGIGAAIVRRADIMQVWPPSIRAYALLGLDR